MTLKRSDAAREVYVLEDSDDSVQAAKSQFAEEHDVPYSETNGSIIRNSGGRSRVHGRRSKYPALCVVVHAP